MKFRRKKHLQAVALINIIRQSQNLSPFPFAFSPEIASKMLEKEWYYWENNVWKYDPFPF